MGRNEKEVRYYDQCDCCLLVVGIDTSGPLYDCDYCEHEVCLDCLTRSNISKDISFCSDCLRVAPELINADIGENFINALNIL